MYGILDFYVSDDSVDTSYHDWVWKIFSEKGAERDQCGVWLSYKAVYEKQRYMDIRPQLFWKTLVDLRKHITATCHSCHPVRNWKIRRCNWNSRRDSLCDPDDFSGGTDLADGKGAEEYV